MSIVGARPIINEEKIKYGDKLGLFLSHKPGMTGLWQVSGRNNVSYNARVAMDIYYIYKQAFLLDLEIFPKPY